MENDSIIILGMGNKLFGDDGAGIVIAEKLEEIYKDNDLVKVNYTNWGGLRIIDLLSGFNSAIVIDAIKTNKFPPGYIHQFDYKQIINSVRMISFHDVNFATAVEFGRKMEIPMPENIVVFAIEANEVETFNENLSLPVETAVDECLKLVCNEVEKIQKETKKELTET